MSTTNYVTQGQLLHTTYAMIALTSVFVVARVVTRFLRPRRLIVEDVLVTLSFVFFIAMSVLYIVVTPAIFRISVALTDPALQYATMLDDALFVTQIFFANTMIFWFVLWSVKFSLLALYKRLLNGVGNKTYAGVWWGVFVFCVVTLIGCIVSNIESCQSMHAWWTPGECSTARDVRAQIASLYYAFAVDVLSDLMIMFLPLRLIWNLQMPRAQKLSVGALFCTGFVCILFSIIRVVQIGGKASNSSTPSSSWLALWASVEGSIAVIIGCCPAFAALYRPPHSTQKVSYDARGYMKHSSSNSSAPTSPSIHMKSMSSNNSAPRNPALRKNSLHRDLERRGSGSQEELAEYKGGGIYVTKTFDTHDEGPGENPR
ncbi:hypothetical protein K504DRAFT_487837 [Pleomassaria siparia CBS 279.74]|uniref:Rhodopsin domain-containing protein n=1 Tax=Pleomassaria siparia CBS 279.74 TaxID=1314801 RepID=A0A6G1KKR8_9PLEO|nr:hypothetical protein K504DRAFT_487837 [Pleomassaria siparia CBS 279.74]